jgi:hypothetical protein
MRWTLVFVLACGGSPPPATPVPQEADWWVAETSNLDTLPPGTVVRFDETEFRSFDPSVGERSVDSRLIRAVQTNVWVLEGSPFTIARNGNTLTFSSPDQPPRSMALRPALTNEAWAAARAFSTRLSREESCKQMDACLEIIRAELGMTVEAVGHTSLAVCEMTRLGVGGRYKAARKPVPSACTR